MLSYILCRSACGKDTLHLTGNLAAIRVLGIALAPLNVRTALTVMVAHEGLVYITVIFLIEIREIICPCLDILKVILKVGYAEHLIQLCQMAGSDLHNSDALAVARHGCLVISRFNMYCSCC